MIEEGKFVQIEYTGTFDDGEVFDSNVGQEPLEFQVGSGMIIGGLDRAVAAMAISDEKDVTVSAADGYGDYNSEFVITVPLKEMNANFKPEPGMVISVQMEDGHLIPARVTTVTGEDAILDLNHPLAGKTLHFKVKVIAVNDEAQLSSGCDCCSGGSCSDDSCGC